MRVQTYPGEIDVRRTPLGRVVLSQGNQMLYVAPDALRALVEAIWRVGTDFETDAQRQKVPS